MVIGGFHELELFCGQEYHPNALALNTGRNALEYILRAKLFKKVFLPYYTCDVMLEPILKLKIEVEFYSIDETLKPNIEYSKIRQDEVLIYTNYFGICDNQVNSVALNCSNLIVDNSQSFYSFPIPGVDTFYSPRKFFGLPDGAYLYTNSHLEDGFEKDISYNRCQHLLGRIDEGAQSHYQNFIYNSKGLCNQPILRISRLTHRLLSSINYKSIAEVRLQNFNFLHEELNNKNKLKFEPTSINIPMVYPFLVENGVKIRRELIDNEIFVATYWPNVKDWALPESFEYNLAENLIPLPIDQRYNNSDMRIIVDLIK